jgi:tripartite-type tricarboxylate transporter receptor subunit TctC
MKLKNFAVTALAGSALLAAPQAGLAQSDYPNQPVVWLAPSSPGSAFDIVARIVTPKLSEVLGQPVVVENVAGAGGTIGAAKAATAKPDGYTILHVNINHTSGEALYKSLSYNLLTSFDPVIRFTTSYHVYVTRKDLEVNSFAEFVELAKKEPGKFNAATAGVGSSTFMATELLKAAAGIEMTHIPYEGGGPALASIVAGETDFYGAPFSAAKPMIDAGEVKPLAISSKEPKSYAPGIPTVAETIPGFEFASWYGLVVPAGTPDEIKQKIRAAMVETIADPTVKAKLAELGFEPIDEGPEQFAAFLEKEVASLKAVVQKAGIEPQ